MTDKEHADRFIEVHNESSTLSSFIDWLDENGMAIAKVNGARLEPREESIEKLLASYFGIDLDAVERHKLTLIGRPG